MSLNVLVVDDSAVMRTMVIRALRMCGLDIGDVHQAANGRDAIEVLDQHWVDLATVDLNMSVMGGWELIEHLRATPSTADLAILVISSERAASTVAELEAVQVGCLHKPFTAESLRDAVQRVLSPGHV